MSAEDAGTVLKGMLTYGLYVIGAKGDGELNGMTANWLSQLSFEPRLIGVAIENGSHTHGLVSSSGVFTVNVLAGGDRGNGFELMEQFTRPQEVVGDKLGGIAFTTAQTGAPVLRDAIGWLDCEVVQHVETGDHTLFIGRVVDGGVQSEEFEPLTLRETGWDYGG